MFQNRLANSLRYFYVRFFVGLVPRRQGLILPISFINFRIIWGGVFDRWRGIRSGLIYRVRNEWGKH